MFEINDKQVKRYEKDLKTFKNKAFPFATKNTLNQLAFKSQQVSRETINSKMILRNKFTINSVRYEKTNTLDVNKQESRVGSIAEYLETQEMGGVKRKTGKHGVAIATSYSAGQEGAKPRQRLPRKPNQIKNIQLQRKINSAKSRKQKNFISIKMAAESNQKYIFLDLGKTKGIFKVIGGKRKPRIKMVYSLSKQSVRIKKNEWLQPSVDKVMTKREDIYKESLIYQLKRNKVFFH